MMEQVHANGRYGIHTTPQLMRVIILENEEQIPMYITNQNIIAESGKSGEKSLICHKWPLLSITKQ